MRQDEAFIPPHTHRTGRSVQSLAGGCERMLSASAYTNTSSSLNAELQLSCPHLVGISISSSGLKLGRNTNKLQGAKGGTQVAVGWGRGMCEVWGSEELFAQNTTYQGRHLFLPCAQACQQASLPKFWSPECTLHLAVMQLTRPSPQPGVPERASPVWESGHRVPPNAWRNDGAIPFCLVL